MDGRGAGAADLRQRLGPASATFSSLASDALARRLGELAGDERQVQVEFLLHLGEFDRRRAFLEAGYDSLWSYCLRALHLREGPAARRIGAMRVLRRFPALEPALRDGRLCLSTVTLLGPLLTDDHLDELVAKAAYRTKAEVEHLAASLQPRKVPRDGIRKVPERAQLAAAQEAPSVPAALGGAGEGGGAAPLIASVVPAGRVIAAPREVPCSPGSHDARTPTTAAAGRASPPATATAPAPPRPETRRQVVLTPVAADQWSLRVTLDTAMKADLEELTSLLSHAKGADLHGVLREALRCGIEKHGKRRGAVGPTRSRNVQTAQPAVPHAVPSSAATISARDAVTPDGTHEPAPAGAPRTARGPIPAAVRREVWRRDGGCCSWTAPDGTRCASRWKIELDHVVPVALGGQSTVANLRLVCRGHNLLHAERVFGREHMQRFVATSRAA